MSDEAAGPNPAIPRPPIETLIAAWRYEGPPTSFAEVVGHERAIGYLRVLAEMLRRPAADLAALRLRIGRGVVIGGPAGVGKTMLARAFASEVEADVIAPPASALDATRVLELYRHLAASMAASGRRAVVVLDEAETLIGDGIGMVVDEDATSALCEALDGIARPQVGPITLAITTVPEHRLSAAATRPGRLAPRLECSLPTRAERLILLERAVTGLPLVGPLDLTRIADQTTGWSGAALAVAVEEACARSLLDHSDALRADLLAAVVAEGYVVEDLARRRPPGLVEAVHEGGHALMASLLLGTAAVVAIDLAAADLSGRTVLRESLLTDDRTVARHLDLARVALAGAVAERLVFGESGLTDGAAIDRVQATSHLLAVHEAALPYSLDGLEQGAMADRGSERMRAALHVAIEARALALRDEVVAALAPRVGSIRGIADAVLAAPEVSLTGAALDLVLDGALATTSPRTMREPLRRGEAMERRGSPPGD